MNLILKVGGKIRQCLASIKFMLFMLSGVFAFQSGEGPVMFVMKRKPSDVIMCRGAYGLSFVGIFISCYGVYLMVHDKNRKKELKP